MTRPIPPVEEPITEDDAFLEEVVQSASIPTIMMSIVHLTGNRDILQGPIRPGPAMLGDTQGGLSDTDRAQVRALALGALKAYRDGGCQLPPPPSPETIHEMMSFMVGQEVPAQYVPMMLEEMALDGQDARDVHWDENVATDIKQRFHVIVIGAGMSGLLAAIRLEEAGIPYTVDREERWRRWHVVREHIPRLPRRHCQPLLLLLVRAQSRLARALLATKGAARLLRGLCGQIRRAPARALRDRGGSHALGRCCVRVGGDDSLQSWKGGETARECDHQRRRPAQPAEVSRYRRAGQLRGRRLPQRRVGARARSGGSKRRGDRHRCERASARARGRQAGRAALRLPALARLDVSQRQLPHARGQRGEEVAAQTRPLLLALVPLPALLARLGRASCHL